MPVLLIILSFVIGFLAPVAYGNVLAQGATPTPMAQPASLHEAESACQMIAGVRGVSECHVMDYPSFDVIVHNIRKDAAETFCTDAAKAIASKFQSVSGKTWKVRVFGSGLVPPIAACRVPAFLG